MGNSCCGAKYKAKSGHNKKGPTMPLKKSAEMHIIRNQNNTPTGGTPGGFESHDINNRKRQDTEFTMPHRIQILFQSTDLGGLPKDTIQAKIIINKIGENGVNHRIGETEVIDEI